MPAISEEGLGPVERGRIRYLAKNYTGALEAFTQAVKQSTGNLLCTALDYRAATHEKLENLQPALKDAKSMIDLKPDGAKGYLRCAKVLQLKGEKELALKIYERGLKKVAIGTDDARTKLQKEYTKLRKALDPGRSRDPLEYLPLEMAEIVIEHLDVRDRVICLAVSKPWKRLLESSHKMWTTLDTSKVKRPVSLNSLKVHLRRSNYTLDKAIINSRSQFDAKKFTFLTRTCKQLKDLRLVGNGIIGSSLLESIPLAKNLTSISVAVGYEIGISTVSSILEICQKSLAHASFRAVTSARGTMQFKDGLKLDALEDFTLDMYNHVPFDMSPLYRAAPKLKSLSHSGPWLGPSIDLSYLQCLEHVVFRGSSLSQMPKLPPTVQTLNLSQNSQLRNIIPEAHMTEHHMELPHLESFDCGGNIAFTAADLKYILGPSIKAGNLKRLRAGNRLPPHSETRPPSSEYPASPTVSELSLSGESYFSEKYLIEVVKLYPNLQKLDVSYTKVTGSAVKAWVEQGIKWLALNECDRVSPDAVEFARGRRVEVDFSFPSRMMPRAFRDRVPLQRLNV